MPKRPTVTLSTGKCAAQYDAVRQPPRVPRRRGAADAEGARRVLKFVLQMQPVDRSLGQQCAFGAGINQQGHGRAADRCLREQHVFTSLDRHLGERDQRAGVVGLLSIRFTAGAGRESEQREQDQRRSDHGVGRTWTVARTEVPSASSTVSR